jgi:hypothetical protein
MKPVRSLCVVAALALCALLASNVGIASATELCANSTCGEVYESGQVVEATLVDEGTLTIATNLGSVVCTESSLGGKTTAKTGTPLPGEVTSASYGGCKLGATGCTVSAVNLPYKASVEETGEGNGTFTLESGGGGNPGAKAVCGALISCTGTAAKESLSVTGGGPAYMSAKEIALTLSGSICPKEAKWSAEFAVRTPEAVLLVGARPTVLCTSAPDGKGVCPKGTAYEEEEIVGKLAAGVANFETYPTPGPAVSCKRSTLEGKFDKKGIGKVEKWEFLGKEKEVACESTLTGNPTVTVTLSNLPFNPSEFMYFPREGAQGLLTMVPKILKSRLTLKITGGATCEYSFSVNPLFSKGLVFNGVGAEGTQLQVSIVWFKTAVWKAPCPVNVLQSTTLVLTGREIGEEINVYLGKSIAP